VDKSNFLYDKCQVGDMHSYRGGNLAQGGFFIERDLTNGKKGTNRLIIIFGDKEFTVNPKTHSVI
jgi:hypothetical protein